MNITKSQIDNFILGSTFLGTGGGGDPKEAREMYRDLLQKKSQLQVLDINRFKNEGIFITAFGVGPVTTSSDPKVAIRKAFKALTGYLDKQIQGIIPVEIGPKSLATAFYLASVLNLPVVDADIVGGRSSPEVFLETITLFNISRTPAVIANNRGDIAMLLKSTSPVLEEKFFRDFAISSGERAYVVGYPLTKRQVTQSLVLGTISKALDIGGLLQKSNVSKLLTTYKGKILFEGTIARMASESSPGFSTQTIVIKKRDKIAKIFIKNENLICWVNNKLAVSCPDLIIMLDSRNKPIFNKNLKKGHFVRVAALPAALLWRSSKGVSLFSPKTFGFNFNAKLL